MYIKGRISTSHQKERYPSSEIRMKWLDENTNDSNRGFAMKAMHAALRYADLYLMKIYEQRDIAKALIKEGRIDEAMEVLDLIGVCESEEGHAYNELKIKILVESMNAKNN